MKNNMMSNKSNQSCAFITVTMPDGTMYAGMIPQLGFVDGAVSRTPSIHITAGNAHVLHPTPAIQEKKGAVMDADPTMARVKANEAINVNLTFQNMLDLVTAFSAYHSLDLHVGEMRYEGFWEGILSGLERLGEIICDISPLYKTLEEAREEEKFFEDILWVKKIKLEKKARMLMGIRSGDDNKGKKVPAMRKASTLRSRIRTCLILSLLFAPTTDSICMLEKTEKMDFGETS